MKFEAVTIKDIAKELNLSTSTVSRALRDSYEISPETKRIVLACAERLDYSPNPIALSLKEKRSHSIGVIVCEIANSFFGQIINGIEAIAHTNGYNVIITQSHESYERELSDLAFLASRSVDGLLISVSMETENMDHLKKLHNRGLPIVLFDRITDELNTHLVIGDNFKGAYDATTHLLDNGYSNIVCMANAEHLSITKERIEGYKKALEDRGITFHDYSIRYCAQGGQDHKEVNDYVTELLKMKQRPDAFIGLSDKITTGILKSLNKKGISVPDDVGLVGFSNSELTEMLNPSLTIIRQPAFEMGELAAKLLLQIIESKRPPSEFTKQVLPTQLIIRESSVRPKKPAIKAKRLAKK